MGASLDSVPLSGIVRIREMMFDVQNPYRLDQGDMSFAAPECLKCGIVEALGRDETHYGQTAGVPRLRELLAHKVRTHNGIPATPEQVLVANGGQHALFVLWQCLLEAGDEVILPDPWWPPAHAHIALARGVPVGCPLREELGWRWDADELARKITPRTRAIYLNTPHNPTGGVLGRSELQSIVDLAEHHDLTIVSDEAYEDYAFTTPHVSIASLPGAATRTFTIFTFSKSYAVTGLRLGYLIAPHMHERLHKLAFYTASNVCTIVQHGGIAALENGRAAIQEFAKEIERRRTLFFAGLERLAGGLFTGAAPAGAVFAFLRVSPEWRARAKYETPSEQSPSWAIAEYLIRRGRVGCVPGVDFGPNGEGYIRFCIARERGELVGALESIGQIFT
jgi:aspartate/methionine/tyrosine aminotransferase